MSFPTHPHLLFRQHHTSTLLAQITICTHTDTVLRLQASQCQNACALAGHTVCHCCNNDEHTQKLDFSHSLIMSEREREREREREGRIIVAISISLVMKIHLITTLYIVLTCITSHCTYSTNYYHKVG
jgi:hypothetical protein